MAPRAFQVFESPFFHRLPNLAVRYEVPHIHSFNLPRARRAEDELPRLIPLERMVGQQHTGADDVRHRRVAVSIPIAAPALTSRAHALPILFTAIPGLPSER